MKSGLKALAFVLVIAFVMGFALFVREARSLGEAPAGVSGDALVVLTGGPNRIATGVSLLQDNRGQRLLISGVNPGVPVSDIAAAAGAPQEVFACCVDVGVDATDTIGNARETARWAQTRGYDSLIVITSDYHMPRALLELRAAMPQIELTAHAVRAEAPWSSPDQARRWLTEYLKYIAVYARERATQLTERGKA